MRFRGFSLLGFFIALFVLSSNTQATTYVATPIFHNAPLKLETKITSQSAKGYCTVVTISNPNDEAHQGWQVEFDLGSNVIKQLHGAIASVIGSQVTVSPYPDAKNIEGHHKTNFSFCMEGPSSPSIFLQSVMLKDRLPSATLVTAATTRDRNGQDKNGRQADYCVRVDITNKGPDPVFDWQLTFDLGTDKLVSIEHGKADKDTGAIKVTPIGGHNHIKKDHVRSIKYCARKGQDACALPSLDDRAPTIAIMSPLNGSNARQNEVLVTGMYSGPDNTGVTVNGVVALTDGRFFYANNVLLQEGNNLIKAVATTPAGKTAENQVRLRNTEESRLQFTASPLSGGLAPLKVKFSPIFISNASIQNVNIDFNGDGVVDFSSNQINVPLEFTYNNPGIYVAKATLTDTSGRVYETAFAVQVLDVTDMDRRFNAIFSNMNNALICGHIDDALLNFSIHSRGRYIPVLGALKGRFADIVRSYSPLQRSILAADFSEYAINRTINGVDRLFLIYFILDEDGVWRIDSM